MVKILIVDDEPDNLDILRDVLTAEGYRVVEAVDGPTGVATARTERPDFVLMDVMIGGNPQGLVATQQLKASADTRHIPVVALTASVLPENRRSAIDAGCCDLVAKPFDFDHLLGIIRKYLPGASA